MKNLSTLQFVEQLPVLKSFYDTLQDENFIAVPDDWFVAVTDVVKSRDAIQQGQYKAVNMAGVAMITAVMNALGHQKIPYIFAGDGSAIAYSPEDHEIITQTLARTRTWVREMLDLQLRAAVVPVGEIRKAGADVRLCGLFVSQAITNYAFSGKGVTLAETMMKDGKFEVEPAATGEYPDLSGLSCRWMPVEEAGSKIISMIVEAGDGREDVPRMIMKDLLDLVRAERDESHPAPPKRIRFKWPPQGLGLEAKATGDGMLKLYLIALLAMVLNKTGWKLGKFEPVHYRNQLSRNTDYRKIHDGLRMTLVMTQDRLSALKAFLQKHHEAGDLRYGLSEQDKAVLTCFVPSIERDDHYHFLDGAGGGYAAAASNLHQA